LDTQLFFFFFFFLYIYPRWPWINSPSLPVGAVAMEGSRGISFSMDALRPVAIRLHRPWSVYDRPWLDERRRSFWYTIESYIFIFVTGLLVMAPPHEKLIRESDKHDNNNNKRKLLLLLRKRSKVWRYSSRKRREPGEYRCGQRDLVPLHAAGMDAKYRGTSKHYISHVLLRPRRSK